MYGNAPRRTIVVTQGERAHEPLTWYGKLLDDAPQEIYLIRQTDSIAIDSLQWKPSLQGCHEIMPEDDVFRSIERQCRHHPVPTCLLVLFEDPVRLTWLKRVREELKDILVVLAEPRASDDTAKPYMPQNLIEFPVNRTAGQTHSPIQRAAPQIVDTVTQYVAPNSNVVAVFQELEDVDQLNRLKTGVHAVIHLPNIARDERGMPELLSAIVFCRFEADELVRRHFKKHSQNYHKPIQITLNHIEGYHNITTLLTHEFWNLLYNSAIRWNHMTHRCPYNCEQDLQKTLEEIDKFSKTPLKISRAKIKIEIDVNYFNSGNWVDECARLVDEQLQKLQTHYDELWRKLKIDFREQLQKQKAQAEDARRKLNQEHKGSLQPWSIEYVEEQKQQQQVEIQNTDLHEIIQAIDIEFSDKERDSIQWDKMLAKKIYSTLPEELENTIHKIHQHSLNLLAKAISIKFIYGFVFSFVVMFALPFLMTSYINVDAVDGEKLWVYSKFVGAVFIVFSLLIASYLASTKTLLKGQVSRLEAELVRHNKQVKQRLDLLSSYYVAHQTCQLRSILIRSLEEIEKREKRRLSESKELEKAAQPHINNPSRHDVLGGPPEQWLQHSLHRSGRLLNVVNLIPNTSAHAIKRTAWNVSFK